MDFNLKNFFQIGGDGEKDQFFAPIWSNRTENAYSDFFKHGGWKKPKNWINPGGVMANPAQQLADPGNFFTVKEHENWVNKGKVSDRTLLSAAVAAVAYGGGALMSGAGSGSAGGGSAGSMSGINAGNYSLMGPGSGGSTSFSLTGPATSSAAPSVAGGQSGLAAMAPSLYGSGGEAVSASGTNWGDLASNLAQSGGQQSAVPGIPQGIPQWGYGAGLVPSGGEGLQRSVTELINGTQWNSPSPSTVESLDTPLKLNRPIEEPIKDKTLETNSVDQMISDFFTSRS